MRRMLLCLALVGGLAIAGSSQAATGHIIKVLPQFLDLKGRNSLTPSLYERDVYQNVLREHTNQCSGMRFSVQWKTKGHPAAPLKLRVELRGVARGDFPKHLALEKPLEPSGWFGRWSEIPLVGDEYKSFGRITAWRVTLWEGSQLIGDQQSFLW
jgi:hypothetical protein